MKVMFRLNRRIILPCGRGESEEELASVGVLARVGHGEDALAVVLLDEVLVGELGTVDAERKGK